MPPCPAAAKPEVGGGGGQEFHGCYDNAGNSHRNPCEEEEEKEEKKEEVEEEGESPSEGIANTPHLAGGGEGVTAVPAAISASSWQHLCRGLGSATRLRPVEASPEPALLPALAVLGARHPQDMVLLPMMWLIPPKSVGGSVELVWPVPLQGARGDGGGCELPKHKALGWRVGDPEGVGWGVICPQTQGPCKSVSDGKAWPCCAPRAPYYPLSPSCNPFQRGGLGGFRAGFESEMGCFQISLRQLCPLSLMQRGIKIDMKIIGGEMAPPP